MKTTNLDPEHQLDVTRGRKSALRSGSTGVTVRDGTTTGFNITDITVVGGTWTVDEDGNAVLTIGGVPGIGSLLPWFIVTSSAYGAIEDNTTDCKTAVNLAIAAMNAAGGGVLYFPGTGVGYLTTGAFDAITVPGIVMGDGIAATIINCSSATATLFTHTTGALERAPSFRDMTIINTHATPTAGAGIRASAGGNYAHYARLRMENWWVGIRHEDGSAWGIDAVTMNDIRKFAVYVTNDSTPDQGDWFISNSAFVASTHSPDAAIRLDNSGGGRIVNSKVNGSDPATGYEHGVEIAIAGTDSTGVFMFSNNSIENVRGDGIHVTQADTAAYTFFVITGNDIHLQDNDTGKAVSFVAEDLGNLSALVIKSNSFWTDGTARTPIELTNVERADITGNLQTGNFNGRAPYTNSASTGIVAYYPGAEVAYQEFTSNVAPTATAEASANTVVTAPAFTFDGQSGWYIEFYCSNARPDVAAESILRVWLFDGSTSLGRIALLSVDDAGTVGANSPILVRRKLTPSAGSHTYSIRATVSAGTGSLNAGAGGAGAVMPGYIRIVKA